GCRPPAPRLTRRARPSGHGLSGVLRPDGGRGAAWIPRSQGKARQHACTDKAYGHGARLDHGVLVRSPSGRRALCWSRPMTGTLRGGGGAGEPAVGRVCCSGAGVLTQPLPLTRQEPGVDVGLKILLLTAEGELVEHPCHYRTAEKALAKAQNASLVA